MVLMLGHILFAWGLEQSGEIPGTSHPSPQGGPHQDKSSCSIVGFNWGLPWWKVCYRVGLVGSSFLPIHCYKSTQSERQLLVPHKNWARCLQPPAPPCNSCGKQHMLTSTCPRINFFSQCRLFSQTSCAAAQAPPPPSTSALLFYTNF